MSRVGTPTDNAVIESLNGWIKAELKEDFDYKNCDNLPNLLEKYVEYFNNSSARYCRFWGWYIPSNETVPVLPEGVSAVVLPWENVGGEDGELYPEDDVIEGVRKARHY